MEEMPMGMPMGAETGLPPTAQDPTARILELVEKIAAALAKAGLPGMSDEDLTASAQDYMVASGEAPGGPPIG